MITGLLLLLTVIHIKPIPLPQSSQDKTRRISTKTGRTWQRYANTTSVALRSVTAARLMNPVWINTNNTELLQVL